MSNYIIHNGELYHHGVKGQKWGVRRYQNPEGSLTPAGKRRQRAGDKDANKLSKTFEKHLDDYVSAQRSTTRYYFVDEKGNNGYRPDGKGYFDTSRGIERTDSKKVSASKASMKTYDSLKAMMSKKYDEVVSKANYDVDTGKATISVMLTRNGIKSVSEIKKEYGEWTQPIQFITYAKDEK